jgi:hypothetical protein
VYGTKSENYITFMSEITDKYVQSIGGQFTAGTKQPYLYDDYFSMQYIYNLKKKYLGGTPAAKLEDLGVTSAIVPEVSNLNTLFLVNFDGTYADSVSGLLPIGTIGNNSLITYGGQSCVLLNVPEDGEIGGAVIYWYPIATINKNSFSLSWNSLGGAGCDVAVGIAGDTFGGVDNPGSIIVGFNLTGSVYVLCVDKNGIELINYTTPTSYFTDNVWHSFNVTLSNGMLTVKLNNNVILTQALDISFVGNITTIGILIQAHTRSSVNAYFDSIKVENVTG